jgi:large subunit ribosomal protein L22
VLNIIRGLPVRRADEVLQYTDRSVSVTIRKVLASAVANAQHNDELDPETLFVKACFADEGPTLKRFTPRARGRAGKIFKRTTHITLVLGVLDDDRLEIVQAREARRTAAGRRRSAASTAPASSRAARVARSRQRAAELRDGGTAEEQGVVDETEELAAAVEEMEATGSTIVPTDEKTEITTTDASADAAATTTVDELTGGATDEADTIREASAGDETPSDAGDNAADAKEDQ